MLPNLMVVVIKKKANDPGALYVYTGAIYEEKKEVLAEYLEAGADPDVAQAFIMLVG